MILHIANNWGFKCNFRHQPSRRERSTRKEIQYCANGSAIALHPSAGIRSHARIRRRHWKLPLNADFVAFLPGGYRSAWEGRDVIKELIHRRRRRQDGNITGCRHQRRERCGTDPLHRMRSDTYPAKSRLIRSTPKKRSTIFSHLTEVNGEEVRKLKTVTAGFTLCQIQVALDLRRHLFTRIFSRPYFFLV